MKTVKSLLAVILVLTLVLSLGLPAIAVEEPPMNTAVYISKDLKIGSGTTTPDATFIFTFAPNADASKGLKDGDKFVEIAARSLNFKGVADAGDNEVITLVTDDILAGLEFPHAGQWAYTVKETSGTYTVNEKETMIYDATEYILRIYVINGENGTEIKGATIEKIENGENGEIISTKVVSTDDGTDGGKNTTDANNSTEKGENSANCDNGFRFTNKYTKIGGGEDDDDGKTNSIVISNDVTGAFGDKTKEFDYVLNVTNTTASEETTFTYVLTKDGESTTLTGTYGEDIAFSLADGDTLIVKDIPVGATYTIDAAGDPDFTLSAVVDTKDFSSAKGEDLAVNGKVSEAGSTAAFTSDYDDSLIPDTGIMINNLPFVMLIAASGLCLCVFFVSKKRHADEA